jgi:hypothetical protein
MKSFFAVLLVAGAMFAPAVVARPSQASPVLGSWAVDVSRLSIPPAARPKRVTITFSDAGKGRWATCVDILDAGGTASHAGSIAALDGTAAPVRDSIEADTVALGLPALNVLVMDLVKGGIPASTRVYTVAADGRTLTETVAYAGGDGFPMMRTNHFTRIRRQDCPAQ